MKAERVFREMIQGGREIAIFVNKWPTVKKYVCGNKKNQICPNLLEELEREFPGSFELGYLILPGGYGKNLERLKIDIKENSDQTTVQIFCRF